MVMRKDSNKSGYTIGGYKSYSKNVMIDLWSKQDRNLQVDGTYVLFIHCEAEFNSGSFDFNACCVVLLFYWEI